MKEHKVITPFFRSESSDFLLANGDAFDLLQRFDFKFDAIFADPPYFHSTEFVIWARRSPSVPHYFDYSLMKELNDGKQMTDVWKLPAIGVWEKEHGKHPTQKPLRLLVRLILASTRQGDWILDPFCGSGTTGIAANLCGRRFAGIDAEKEYCDLAVARRQDLDNNEKRLKLMHHINDLDFMNTDDVLEISETSTSYGLLPF